MSQFEEGQRVRATMIITEGGPGTAPNLEAPFPDQDYVHSLEGGLGTVGGADMGAPTVRWDFRGTATIVGDDEIELVQD